MADLFNIAGRIHSTSNEEVVVTTDEILDSTFNLKQNAINNQQSEINTLLSGAIETLNTTVNGSDANSINSRLTAVEALGEISVGGGDIEIANNASDIVSGSSKIPTANAIAGVLNSVIQYEIID